MGGLVEQLRPYQQIALDSNIFISALEGEQAFSGVTDFFQELAQSEWSLHTSTVTLTEVTVRPFRLGLARKAVLSAAFVYADGRCKVWPVNAVVAMQAARLRAHFMNLGKKLETEDAIQLATAVASRSEVFVSADRIFANCEVSGIKILHLSPA